MRYCMEAFTDHEYKIYQQGIKKGMKHTSSSQDTIERFKIMEDKLDKFNTKLDGFGDKLHKLEILITALPEKFKEMGDARYAPINTKKTIEDFTWWFIRSAIIIILGMGGTIGILIYSLTQLWAARL